LGVRAIRITCVAPGVKGRDIYPKLRVTRQAVVNLLLTLWGLNRPFAAAFSAKSAESVMADGMDEGVGQNTAERRRFKRVPVELSGRLFIPSESREARCKVMDMSPGGARVASDVVLEAGTQIVVYIDGFGRFEGSVARSDGTTFGIQFSCSAHKRERVAEQLTLYLNGGSLDESSLRRHDRTPTQGLARFTRANGEVVNCEVLDLSLSGVSLATEIKPPVGEFVLIGQMAGRVARHHERGIGIEFVAQDKTVAEPPRPKLFIAS